MTNFKRKQGIFCNRTLNLRSIEAVGYDMDYTLIHYNVEAWEKCAYEYLKEGLLSQGWPVDALAFDASLAMQGLIVDLQEGNVVKANRFGYIKRSFHGTKALDYSVQRKLYQGTLVDLNDPRWRFMNTQFSISELSMYMQLVDLLDEGRLPHAEGYDSLYRMVRKTLDEAHLEGLLKQDIIQNRERFVERDENIPLALLDQKKAGKKVLLITNSEWSYAAPMLAYTMDPFLPGDMTWRDLFDYSIVGARKPDFFSSRAAAFEIVDNDGLLRVHNGPLQPGGVYVGGNAGLVEQSLNLSGDKILYVGDHIYSDVKVSKTLFNWRTALILRELEEEIDAIEGFQPQQQALSRLMHEKEDLEGQYSALRLEKLRNIEGYGPQTDQAPQSLDTQMQSIRQQIVELDQQITPYAVEAGRLNNPNWGLLMRAGNDKSLFAKQVERSADLYTARVSNFAHYTPFVYLRSYRGQLPHNPEDYANYHYHLVAG